jgi:hypothetical protein
MDQQRVNRRIKEVESLGLSLAEFHVLDAALIYPTWIADVATATFNELRYDQSAQPLEAYVKAVESCLQTGWLREVTEEQYVSQAAALDRESFPDACGGIVAEPGTIDLTTAGYRLYRQAAVKFYGPARSGMRYVAPALQVEVYSDSDEDCRLRAGWYLENKERHFYPEDEKPPIPVAFDHLEGPFPVGPWRYNRFEVVPNGFLVVLQYVQTIDDPS